nr:magnesium transporter [Thalassobacillus sp. C254]
MLKLNFKNREEYTFYLHLYLKQGEKEKFRHDFLALHPTDQSEILFEYNEPKRKQAFQYLSSKELAEIFQELEPSQQKQMVSELSEENALEVFDDLAADDITDFFSEIPEHIATYYLNQMEQEDANNIKHLLSYDERTAGSIMTTEFITLQEEETVSQTLERLSREGKTAETIYYLYIVNKNNELLGVVSLRDVITSAPNLKVAEIMKEQFVSVHPFADQEEVSQIIHEYDFLAVPVVNDARQIMGIVTIDDILDIVEEETTEDIGEMSAVKGAIDLDVTAFHSAMKRLPWLLLLMVLGMATAGLIGTFEETLAQLAVLAVFIPLIADMGGTTGTQSLAVVVRLLALGEIEKHTLPRLMKRELIAGLILGSVCGFLVMGIVQIFAFGDLTLALVVSLSLFGTIFISNLTGTLIPLVINRLKIDLR